MSARPLFREQAIEFQRGQRDFGELALLHPVSTSLLGWLLIGVVAIAIVFLCFAQFSRKQTVAGYLAPAAGTLKVFPKREGVVTAVYVKQGQDVHAGDPLFLVATPEIAAGGEDVNAATLTALHNQKTTLLDQIAAEQRNAASERARLTAAVTGTESQIRDLQAQLTIQTQRIDLANNLMAAAKDLLAKGYMSVVESQRRQDQLLEQQQTLASLRRQITESQNKLAEAKYALKELPIVTARKVQPLRDQVFAVEQQIAQGKGRTSFVVRAPADGRIAMLQSAAGQSVTAQQLQLEIVPASSPLQAELLIPTRAAGLVHEGQEVRLLYDAFPYQNYGAHSGRLSQLSRTVLTHTDLAGPIDPKEPVYKAIATLDRSEVEANGRAVPLQPGMLLQAEIILDRRSLAAWLLDSLLHRRT